MKTLICHGAGDLRLEEQPEPGPPQADQIQVQLAYGGICGSDLHYHQHGGFGTVRLKEPMALGHEVSGLVAAVGTAVRGFSPGDPIAISPSRPCTACRFCQRGLHNQCLHMRFYGSAMPFPHVQGAFSETLLIDARQAHRVEHGLDLSLAALAEPLSVGLHAIHRAGDVLGKQVLVTGCGPIGSLLIGALRRAGAARIVAVDLAELPLACARQMGADETINIGTEAQALAPYQSDKGQFDVVFEASGSPAALHSALDLIAPRGTLVTVGLGGDLALPMNKIVAKEIDLRGSFRFHTEFATALRFLSLGLIDGTPVISRIVPLEHAIEAFELAADKRQSLKVQIAFSAGQSLSTLTP
jgi:L-idonate 5-dehydrogenase